MIYVTGDAELSDLPSATVFHALESLTGADALITPVDLPLTPALLPRHISSGATLVQIKHGHDLSSSISDRRLHFSLARMRETGARTSQCVLLFIGYMQEIEGDCYINSHLSMIVKSFWSVQSAIDKWTEEGGVYINLHKNSLIPIWAKKKEERLRHYLEEPKREIIASSQRLITELKDDPLQEVIEINDYRKTLITLPGIGAKSVRELTKAMKSSGAVLNFLNALTWLTTPRYVKDIYGVGKGTMQNIREYIGLEEGMGVYIMPDDNSQENTNG